MSIDWGPLKKPSVQAIEVFKKTIENNPDADMRAIPNEWLLKERGVSAEFSEHISRLESKLEDADKELSMRQQTILTLNGKVNALEDRLDTLTADRDQWKGRADQLQEERDEAQSRLGEALDLLRAASALVEYGSPLLDRIRAALVERGSTIECGCYECVKDKTEPVSGLPISAMRMIVCAICGNKRCPHATDHRNTCTDSNEPGQLGSRYERAKPRCDNIPCARDAGHEGECCSFRALGE